MNRSLTNRTLIFIPSLNDCDHLKVIVDGIKALELPMRCLVVDDGSDPPLGLDHLPDDVLRCRLPDNMGIGFTTGIALEHAWGYGYNSIVRIDADNQHPISRIPDLMEGLVDGSLDIVAGTRSNRNDGEKLPLLRKLVRGYFALVTRLLTKGNAPSDVNTGFIAFGPQAIDRLRAEPLGRFPEPEIFVAADRNGLKVGEISVDQKMRTTGKSTLTFFTAFRMVLRFTVFALGEVTRRIL